MEKIRIRVSMEKIRVMVSVKQLGLGWARKHMKKSGLSLKKLGLAWKKLGLGLASLTAPAPNFIQSLSWPPSITTKSVGTHPETNHFQQARSQGGNKDSAPPI